MGLGSRSVFSPLLASPDDARSLRHSTRLRASPDEKFYHSVAHKPTVVRVCWGETKNEMNISF